MNPIVYQKNVLRTASSSFRIYHVPQDMQHAAIGIATESGELLDNIKKTVFYGKPFSYLNAKEELGDILWYVTLGSDALGLELNDLMESNIAKLKARYPEKFTSEKALNRDLNKEQAALETHE